MAKKKRQLRLLLLLLAVAVALFVAAFCWNRWQTAQEEAEAEAAVIHVDLVEEPTKLRYSNGTDTITFEKSGESWVSAEETDFPVNSDTVDTFVDTLTSLTAEREISVKDDLSAYGLEKPKQWVELTDKEGNSATLYLGSASGELYYAQKKDGETIYTISSDVQSQLSQDLYAWASLAQFPTLSSSNLQSVTLEGKLTSKLEIRGVEVESEDTGDSSADASASSSAEATEPEVEYHWYLTGEVDVTEEAYLSALRTEVNGLSFDSLADFQPQNLKQYGLDDPTAVLKMVYQDDSNRKQTVTLELGKTTKDSDGTECRYATLNGDKTEVYRISVSKVEQILAGAKKGYAKASADYNEAQANTAS